MKLRLAFLVLLSGLVLRGADALPLFNATLTVGKEHRFVLIDSAGKASSFLGIGDRRREGRGRRPNDRGIGHQR